MSQLHLNIEGIKVAYGASPVLDRLDLVVPQGQLLGVLGPNGSGKSTLLRVLSKNLKPVLGRVLLEERDLRGMAAREVAREMAVVGQENPMDFPFTVTEVVSMGRMPHLRRFQKEGAQDRQRVQEALALTRTEYLAERRITELSGGEKQRVIIARALAQEPRLLLLDEPTSHLDINHQVEILEIVRRLNREQGMTVVMALHDLNLASEYCDRLMLLKEGRIYAAGTPQEVITRQCLADVYGNQVLVRPHPLNGRPQVILLPASETPRQEVQGQKVHVVSGGGQGTGLIHRLVARGFAPSAGVLNVGDSDWEQARMLGLPLVQAPPFSPVEEDSHRENLEHMSVSRWVVLAPTPFGWGNVNNMEAIYWAAQHGVTIKIIDAEGLPRRDHSGGRAAKLLDEILSLPNVEAVQDEEQAVERLTEEAERDG